MTYISHLEISQSIFDLTFVTLKIVKNVIDWTINNEIVTKSDHEIISLNFLSKNASKVDNLLNASNNVQKTNWGNFEKNLQLNYAAAKSKIQMLI